MRHAVLILLALVATFLGTSPSQSALIMRGSWNVTLCTDPDRTDCSIACYVFARVAGTVAGSGNSGLVSRPGSPGSFDGKFLQLSDRVSFWGTTQFGSIVTVVFFDGAFLSPTELNGDSVVGFFFDTSATGPTIGSWRAVKVASCPEG
jgi:hypothetical protein